MVRVLLVVCKQLLGGTQKRFKTKKIYHKHTYRETVFDWVVRKTKILFSRWYAEEILLIRWYSVGKRLGTPELSHIRKREKKRE